MKSGSCDTETERRQTVYWREGGKYTGVGCGWAGRTLLCGGGGIAWKPICPPPPPWSSCREGGFGPGVPYLPCPGGGGSTPVCMAQNDTHVALIILTTHMWGGGGFGGRSSSVQNLCSGAFGGNIRPYTKQRARHGSPVLDPPPSFSGRPCHPPPPPMFESPCGKRSIMDTLHLACGGLGAARKKQSSKACKGVVSQSIMVVFEPDPAQPHHRSGSLSSCSRSCPAYTRRKRVVGCLLLLLLLFPTQCKLPSHCTRGFFGVADSTGSPKMRLVRAQWSVLEGRRQE